MQEVEVVGPHAPEFADAELFQLLVDAVSDHAIFALDPAGYVVSWNAGAQRLKGYAPDEIIGKHFSVFYPTQEIRRGKPDYALRVAASEGRWEEDGWRLRNDGSRFWANVIIIALRDPTGRLIGFANVIRDLTERRQAEELRMQLLELERAARTQAETALERLADVQSLTEVALAHLSLKNLLQALLERIRDLLAVDSVSILLKEDDVLVARAAEGLDAHLESEVRIPMGAGFAGRVAAECRPVVIDDTDQTKTLGPTIHAVGLRSLLGVPLLVGGELTGVLHVGSLRHRRFTDDDVQLLQLAADRVALAIDHARLYEVSWRANAEAEAARAAIQLRDEFLSIAAHELKTPLTSLLTATQLLSRQVDRSMSLDPDALRRRVHTLEQQTRRIGRLVGHLLDVSRIQAGRLRLECAAVDLASLVRSVASAMADERVRIQARGPVLASADPFRVEQVVVNLLDNALKFSPSGSTIDVKVRALDANHVGFTVRDHGIGVPPESRERIFDRFHQAHLDQHRSGLGLGLYISRQIVELHGGQIRAEFPDGGGTRIVVTLPAAGHLATEKPGPEITVESQEAV